MWSWTSGISITRELVKNLGGTQQSVLASFPGGSNATLKLRSTVSAT